MTKFLSRNAGSWSYPTEGVGYARLLLPRENRHVEKERERERERVPPEGENQSPLDRGESLQEDGTISYGGRDGWSWHTSTAKRHA